MDMPQSASLAAFSGLKRMSRLVRSALGMRYLTMSTLKVRPTVPHI
jgi:hypothetical protein